MAAAHETKTQKTKTQHVKGFIESKLATTLYNTLKTETKWHDAIKKNSRKAFSVPSSSLLEYVPDVSGELLQIIQYGMLKHAPNTTLLGIYYNYYRNGNDHTPNHSHPGTIQMIFSLGETRKLIVGKKEIKMKNGDLAVFGSSIHGVPKEENRENGRISIALFLKRN